MTLPSDLENMAKASTNPDHIQQLRTAASTLTLWGDIIRTVKETHLPAMKEAIPPCGCHTDCRAAIDALHTTAHQTLPDVEPLTYNVAGR